MEFSARLRADSTALYGFVHFGGKDLAQIARRGLYPAFRWFLFFFVLLYSLSVLKSFARHRFSLRWQVATVLGSFVTGLPRVLPSYN